MNGKTHSQSNQVHSLGDQNTPGVEKAVPESSGGGREHSGQTSSGAPSSFGEQSRDEDPDGHEHRLRRRHLPRVLQIKDLDKAEESIHAAFRSGDPRKAWEATKELIEMSHLLQKEAATARFTANFGTETCTHCEGLKAGPDVAATCFQLRQCYYTNLKVGPTQKQSRLIELLSKTSDPNSNGA